MALDSKSAPDFAFTVCATSSLLVQRTVCPTRAVTFSGTKRMSFMSTWTVSALEGSVAPLDPPLSFSPHPAASTSSRRAMTAREDMAGGYGADLPRHLLTGEELSAQELHRLLERAVELKAAPTASRVFEDRTVALLFEHP